MAVEAAYIGNKGTHVFAGFGGDYDFNQARIEGFGTLTTNQRKPYFQKFGWSQNFRYYGSDASNNYHAHAAEGREAFLARLLAARALHVLPVVQLHEHLLQHRRRTWPMGRTTTTAPMCSACTACGSCRSGRAGDISATQAGFSDALVGGWQVNTVYTWQSGLPFTPTYRDCNADRDTGWCRPDLVGEWKLDNPTAEAWFVTTPLAADGRVTPLTANGQTLGPWRRPERGMFGNVGRNRLLGPSFSQRGPVVVQELRGDRQIPGTVPGRSVQPPQTP